MTERWSEDSRVLALPLLASLICTGAAVSLFSLPQHASFNWPQLLAFEFLYVGAAACVHVCIVWCVCRALRERLQRPIWLLACEIWVCIGWLIFVSLLAKERSLWLCAGVPLTVGSSVRFFKSKADGQDDEEASGELRHREIFDVEEGPSAWRALFPTAIIAIGAEAGVAALLGQQIWIAGVFFAMSAGILVWRSPWTRTRLYVGSDLRRVLRSTAIFSFFILALAGAALMPFLKRNHDAHGLEELLGIQRAASLRSPSVKPTGSSATGYPGIILMLPPKPHHKVIPPISSDPLHWTGTLAKPLEIPFDGAYWYFQIPDNRPGPDAHIQRGNPITKSIRSTNRIPIEMEAHQTLESSINMSCCKAMQLNLVNADNEEGRIAVEVLLSDTVAKRSSAVSLGSLVIPSSKAHFISFQRPPTSESMTFRFPPKVHGARFNEITVIVRPDWDRALAGSKISIQSFLLLP